MSGRLCQNCGRECAPRQWRQQRCSTCWMWRRRHGTERPLPPPKAPPPVDDGRRELYVVESYGAGWYCLAAGRWWQVPAHRHGWRKRKATVAPTAARLVAGDWRFKWMAWLGIPGVPA